MLQVAMQISCLLEWTMYTSNNVKGPENGACHKCGWTMDNKPDMSQEGVLKQGMKILKGIPSVVLAPMVPQKVKRQNIRRSVNSSPELGGKTGVCSCNSTASDFWTELSPEMTKQ